MTEKRNLESAPSPVEQSAEPAPSKGGGDTHTQAHENRRRLRAESLAAWKQLVERHGAQEVCWESDDLPGMVAMLNEIAASAREHQMLYPDGGYLELEGASLSHETGCIELLNDESPFVVQPESLTLVVPEQDPLREWAYFRLETEALEPSGVNEYSSGRYEEEVLELRPGEYVDRLSWSRQFDDGNEPPLPAGARILYRHFKGPFLIVPKACTYMAYDKLIGFHAMWGADGFRRRHQDMLDYVNQEGTYGVDPRAPRPPDSSTP